MLDNAPYCVSEDAILRKIAWRLIPFLGVLYLVAFLDRVNVGFAALTMNAQLAFSATVFGQGAGIFFLGYVLFEVPSNVLLHRVGARRWIARIMMTWGLLSAAMAFIRTPAGFYALRFLLGVAEAGFFPGMILYLTYWFPAHYRGRILGAFMVALPLSTALGAPISTALLGVTAFGLSGWQWLFLLEGLPAVLLGLVVLKALPDRPQHAKWLTVRERECLVRLLAETRETTGDKQDVNWTRTLVNRTVWLLGFQYCALLVGLYGLNFWLPQILETFGNLTHAHIGVLAMLPNLVAAAGMYHWGLSSDATGERRWHVALPAFLAAIGLTCAALFTARQPVLMFLSLTVSALGIYAVLPVFWTLPTATLRGAAAASGIAVINSIGNLGGYLGSSLMGQLKGATGVYDTGLAVLAASMALGGVLSLMNRGRNRQLLRGDSATLSNTMGHSRRQL